jgi:uncharacterized protein (DUF433 family)
MRKRNAIDPLQKIEFNPRICNGKPVIKGTRIPVSVILESVAFGQSWGDILKEYPELGEEDIRAALLYATAAIDHSDIRAAYA